MSRFVISSQWSATVNIVCKEIVYTIDIPLFSVDGSKNNGGSAYTKHFESTTEVSIKSEKLSRYGDDFRGEARIKEKEIFRHYREGCRDDCEGNESEKDYPQVLAMGNWRYKKEDNDYYYDVSFNTSTIIGAFKAGVKERGDSKIILSTIEKDNEHLREITGEIYR